MKAVIVNDTTGPHFGCQLVMEGFRYQLDRVCIELLGTVAKRVKSLKQYPAFVRDADLVLVNGEGSIHHGKRGELIDLAAEYPAVLLNCVYQDNPCRESLRKFLYVSARESLSAQELRRQGIAAEVVPDCILTSPTLNSFHPGRPLSDLGFTDCVSDAGHGVTAMVGLGNARRFLEAISQYRRLCTGRFHGVLAASVLGIPFSAWSSNTHKTRGVMKDMGVEHLFAEERMQAAALVPSVLPDTVTDYVRTAKVAIDRLFERLHGFV